MLHEPFYDPTKSYEDNYERGPFAAFADRKIHKHKNDPQDDFLGLKVHLAFGIPAGPLLNSKFIKGAFKKALKHQKKGQVLILSFMGTVRPNQTQQEFIDDNIQAAKLAKETGVKVLEVNLSCPNIGNEGLVCYNLAITAQILKGIRKVIGS